MILNNTIYLKKKIKIHTFYEYKQLNRQKFQKYKVCNVISSNFTKIVK